MVLTSLETALNRREKLIRKSTNFINFHSIIWTDYITKLLQNRSHSLSEPLFHQFLPKAHSQWWFISERLSELLPPTEVSKLLTWFRPIPGSGRLGEQTGMWAGTLSKVFSSAPTGIHQPSWCHVCSRFKLERPCRQDWGVTKVTQIQLFFSLLVFFFYSLQLSPVHYQGSDLMSSSEFEWVSSWVLIFLLIYCITNYKWKSLHHTWHPPGSNPGTWRKLKIALD